MKRTTLSTGLYILLVFLSGAVVGAFAHRLYVVNTVVSAKPDEVRRKHLEELRNRLSLSDEQVAQYNAIMDATRARYHEVKLRSRRSPKIRSRKSRQSYRSRSAKNTRKYWRNGKNAGNRVNRTTAPNRRLLPATNYYSLAELCCRVSPYISSQTCPHGRRYPPASVCP
jgi:hypothetical protein